MDNNKIYQYRFDELLNLIRRDQRKRSDKREDDMVIDICGNSFRDYQNTVLTNESWCIYSIEKIVTDLLKLRRIEYSIPRYNETTTAGYNKVNRPFAFVIKEPIGNIAYVFQYKCKTGLIEMRNTFKKYGDIDGIRIYFLQYKYNKEIEILNTLEREEDNSFIEFFIIKDLFDDKFGNFEYPIFLHFANKFNERARTLIGLKISPMPTSDTVNSFKKAKEDMIKNIDYSTILPNTITQEQKDAILENYIHRSHYKIMIGTANFSDSFISSEWYYGIQTVNGTLEQTGVVAGYLKSVEQLLYSLIRLSINTNREIKKRNSPETMPFTEAEESSADTTLGSLIHFIKGKDQSGNYKNADLFVVNPNTIQIIIDELYSFKDFERNELFHKDNLYSNDDIDRIRCSAITLYCLLIGSFHISDREFMELMGGDISDLSSLYIKEEDLYELISNWAIPVLMFDMPDETQIVAFNIFEHPKNNWTLCLQGLNEIPTEKRNTYEWNHSLLYSSTLTNNCLFWTSNREYQEELNILLAVLRKNINSNHEFSDLLMQYKEVVIGNLGVIETLFNNQERNKNDSSPH